MPTLRYIKDFGDPKMLISPPLNLRYVNIAIWLLSTRLELY
ncbi:hypothetical protein MC7420_193 [Coleofasciculus chthonoplastes PCC 7420]|uniref:Uncharacterized protein n=1 Tax=Coleofasciculus chthonoplastes PCC 7420 TaxID=118168 RepID=B4VLY9_9CYAN|nr:hypothetical protein MC7420_193 [Coleofasciculus chthonoplastes PCC 7420]